MRQQRPDTAIVLRKHSRPGPGESLALPANICPNANKCAGPEIKAPVAGRHGLTARKLSGFDVNLTENAHPSF